MDRMRKVCSLLWCCICIGNGVFWGIIIMVDYTADVIGTYKPDKSQRNGYRDDVTQYKYVDDDVIQKFIEETTANLNHTKRGDAGCEDYVQSANMVRPVMRDILKQSAKPQNVTSITMVTQMSWSRSNMFYNIIKHWNGPVSVCIYGDARLLNKIIKNITEALNDNQNQPNRQMLVHFVHQIGRYYPINYLRNVALRAASTQYVLLNDVDFIPMLGAHDKLLTWMHPGIKQLLVVPAFEEKSRNNMQDIMPASKSALLKAWKNGEVQYFHEDTYPRFHRPTNFSRWKMDSDPYHVSYVSGFEPYVVGEREQIPLYTTIFVDRGMNKIIHLLELNAIGFKFVVCPDVFLLHLRHTKLHYSPGALSCTWKARRRFDKYIQSIQNNRSYTYSTDNSEYLKIIH